TPFSCPPDVPQHNSVGRSPQILFPHSRCYLRAAITAPLPPSYSPLPRPISAFSSVLFHYASGCFGPEILQEIEVGSAAVVDGDHLAIHNRSLGQIGECLHDIGKLSVKKFYIPGEQVHTSWRLHRKRSISVEFNFPNARRALRQS